MPSDYVESYTIDIEKIKKQKKILEEIKLLQCEFEGNAPVDILKQNMLEKYDMNEEKVENYIRLLKAKGIIYEPIKSYLIIL